MKKTGILSLIFAMVLILSACPGVSVYAEKDFTGWVAITSETKTLNHGVGYYLADDVEISQTLKVSYNAFTCIDLNGHMLRMTGEGTVVDARNAYSFTIIDSNPNTVHKFKVSTEEGSKGLWIPDENGEKTVNGGVITGGNAANGGGIYTPYYYFLMEGGSIVGCKSTGRGGGIYLYTLNALLSDATIAGCIAYDGGAIYNRSITGGVSTMKGGTIKDCVSFGEVGGGGGICNAGYFILDGGTVSGCTAWRGGGIYSSGTFVLKDGTVSNCAASDSGGGVFTSGESTFTMKGGTIKDCTASSVGGGIECYTASTVNMSGGEISNCSTKYGGGVCIEGVFNMSGGTIKECSAEVKGGGIDNNNVFVDAGGTVKDCKADVSDDNIKNSSAYAIKFMCGGNLLATEYVYSGHDIVDPGLKKPEYITKWYTDPELTTEAVFGTASAEATFYGKFEKCSHENMENLSCPDCGIKPVATVLSTAGEKTYYEDIQEAFSAADNGATVEVLKELTYTDTLEVSTRFTLSYENYKFSKLGSGSLIKIKEGGNLTIDGINGTSAQIDEDIENYGTLNVLDFLVYEGSSVINHGILNANGGEVQGNLINTGTVSSINGGATDFCGNVENSGTISAGIYYKEIKGDGKIDGHVVSYMGDKGVYAREITKSAISMPSINPTAETKGFSSWYYDEALTRSAKKGDTVDKDMTIYPKWVTDTASTETELASLLGVNNTVIKLVNDITLTSEAVVSTSASTIDLNGYVLKYDGKQNSPVLYVPYGSTLTIKDSRPDAEHKDKSLPKGGVITGGNAEYYGGGVTAIYSTLIMEGGTIYDCHTKDCGGAVYVVGGFVNMAGGKIFNCSAEQRGGAIFSYCGAIVCMTNGEISGCTSKGDSSAIENMDNSKFFMAGGKIESADRSCVNFKNTDTSEFYALGGAVEGEFYNDETSKIMSTLPENEVLDEEDFYKQLKVGTHEGTEFFGKTTNDGEIAAGMFYGEISGSGKITSNKLTFVNGDKVYATHVVDINSDCISNKTRAPRGDSGVILIGDWYNNKEKTEKFVFGSELMADVTVYGNVAELTAEKTNDGKSLSVGISNYDSTAAIIVSLSNGEHFVGKFKGEKLTFTPKAEFESAKIFVWKTLESMVPLCEEVKIGNK